MIRKKEVALNKQIFSFVDIIVDCTAAALFPFPIYIRCYILKCQITLDHSSLFSIVSENYLSASRSEYKIGSFIK